MERIHQMTATILEIVEATQAEMKEEVVCLDSRITMHIGFVTYQKTKGSRETCYKGVIT
jgi:hypothetical protein